MRYLIIHDSSDDFCTFEIQKSISEEDIDNCLNVGDIQILDLDNSCFLVDANNEGLVWQKIQER